LVAVRAEVTKRAEPGQKQKAVRGHIPFTPRAKKVLELALREALKLGNNYIGTEHILIADGSRASSRTKGQDASTAQLLTRLSEMTSQLVKDELRLATAELTPKGKKAGMGAGLFGGAGVTALFGVGALVACAISPWTWCSRYGWRRCSWAPGIAALLGKKQASKALPAKPGGNH